MEDDDALEQILSDLQTQASLTSSCISALQSLLDAGDGDQLWPHLSSHGIPPSALVSALSAAMDCADCPRRSLIASRLYLSLILSPSSPTSSLFDPGTFFSLLSSLRRSVKPHTPPDASARPLLSSDSHETARKKTGRKRKGRGCGGDGGGLGEDSAGNLGDLIFEVLKLVESAMRSVRLDRITDGVKSLVETVVVVLNSAVGQLQRGMSDVCFRVLYGVISRQEHGDQTQSTVQVLKSLVPLLLSHTKSGLRTLTHVFVVSRLLPQSKENEAVKKAIVYLPRYLAVRAPEKSEPRACAVDAILEVVRAMETEDQVGFAGFVVEMSRGKAQLRLLAVDLILALLTSLHNPLGEAESDDCWGRSCLGALLDRCSDVTASIRARALINISQAIEFLSKDLSNHTQLKELMTVEKLNDLLRKRCADEKAAVKKAALLLTSRTTILFGVSVDEVVLKMAGVSCSDPLVSIRKAAMTALSEAFRQFLGNKVITEWLRSVPRLIIDNETSIQEECENLFLELVLDWICRVGNANLFSSAKDSRLVLPDGLMALMEGLCDGEVVLYVKKICTSLGKKKKMKASVVISLQNIITASESAWLMNNMPIEKWSAPPGCWMLLSELSPFVPKAINWEFLHHHWELLDKSNSLEGNGRIDKMELNSVSWASDRVSLLEIISNVAMELPPEPAADLAHSLFQRIECFNMHSTEIDAHVKALRTLCKRKAVKPKEGDTLVSKWVHQLLSKAQIILESCISGLSEVSNLNSFLTPQTDKRRRKREATQLQSTNQAVNAIFTVGSIALVCPSADMKGIIPLLHTVITSEIPIKKPKKLAGLTHSLKETIPSLYIQSWVTMGKICLGDDKLAKRYIPLFVQELERSDSAALRNNIMLMMVDFCVRHTALVDCYIPKLANLLRDPSEIVRRQTFILLSRLLQRDYVKWRGVLFLRFLLPLVDDSEKIRLLADFLFGNILKVKAPLLAYNSFVEAIFVLNDCHAHAGHSDSFKTGSQLFSLRGNDERSRAQRMHVYTSLLKQMAPEQLLATSAKLCAEVLAAASDGLLNLDDVTAQSVLQDALEILACKEMRIQSPRGTDVADMDEEGGSGAALLAARGRAVTQVSKKNLIQHAVPIFIELKRLLESKNSPLTGCLMECLRVLLKDYKNEIEDILVADKQLQKELIYDMQKYEGAKTKSTVAEAVSTMQIADGFRSPHVRGNIGGSVYTRVSEQLGNNKKITSAIADVAARVTARTVLKEISGNIQSPPFHSMSVPKVKSTTDKNCGDVAKSDRSLNLLESVKRRHAFDSEDEGS